MEALRSFRRILKRFVAGFIRHDVMTLAAALSFYTALSLAPLLLITLAVVGWLGGDMREAFLAQVVTLMGAEAGASVRAVVDNVRESQLGNVAGFLGIGALLFSASTVFAQLQSSLNTIWNASLEPTKSGWASWVKKRLLSMGMVFTLAFLGMVSLMVSAVLSFLFDEGAALWEVVNFVVSLGLFALVFACLFKYLPDTRLNWRSALSGGVLTAVLFTVGKHLIGLYLGQSAVGSAYGAAGSLVLLLVWVYYSSVIVFVGAEFTRVLSNRFKGVLG